MISSLIEKKTIRKFGFMALIFFGSLLVLSIWRERFVFAWVVGCLATLGLGFILLPAPLAPAYHTWERFGRFMGKTVTVIVMALAYYIVITPIAVFMKIVRKTPLPLHPDKNRSSYWVERLELAQPRQRYLKRF